jgi:endonuclease/exonuclease/phosphatase family metal-dependent hydrolase
MMTQTSGTGSLRIIRPAIAPPAGNRLDVITWNLGYGGLGRASDFIVDGGSHILPPSSAAVAANVSAIASVLARMNAEIYVLPETAKRGPLNYWNNMLGEVNRVMGYRERFFHPSIITPVLPFPLRIEHGLSFYSGRHISRAESVPLPQKRARAPWLFQHRYAAHLVYLPVAGGLPDWLIIGVHLPAFDDRGLVRKAQLASLLEIAKSAHKAGHPVILAGDWNFILTPTSFPHNTETKFLSWLHPFPAESLPEGWRIAVDQATPTVRTNERSYRDGENYTTIIDGFIVSPGIEIETVTTEGLSFVNSDHNPVRLRARRLDAQHTFSLGE